MFKNLSNTQKLAIAGFVLGVLTVIAFLLISR